MEYRLALWYNTELYLNNSIKKLKNTNRLLFLENLEVGIEAIERRSWIDEVLVLIFEQHLARHFCCNPKSLSFRRVDIGRLSAFSIHLILIFSIGHEHVLAEILEHLKFLIWDENFWITSNFYWVWVFKHYTAKYWLSGIIDVFFETDIEWGDVVHWKVWNSSCESRNSCWCDSCKKSFSCALTL